MTVIAIDGPAGSGKSTVARALADRLQLPHVDTGAYYRALTLAVLDAGAGPDDAVGVMMVLERSDVSHGPTGTVLDGRDVEHRIRGAAVTAAVSAVARHTAVRQRMVVAQRAAVGPRGAVVEGRDAATVIVPDADLKVWLTAPTAVRAARRARQQGAAAGDDIARVSAELAARDHADRDNSVRADDAVTVDTADRTVDEVVDDIVALHPAPAHR